MTKINTINIVKRRLWASGYAVSERSREVDGYDLLVGGKWDYRKRVRVISAKSPKDIDFGDFTLVTDPGEPGKNMYAYDILAVVITATFGKPLVGYCIVGNPTPTITIAEAFGLSASKKNHHGKKNKKVAEKSDSKEAGT